MNLNVFSSLAELQELFAVCNDNAGHHILWVDLQGEVRLDKVPDDLSPIGFKRACPDMKMRMVTFQKGNDYVGENAARDESFMRSVYDALLNNWETAKGYEGVLYVETIP
ncbi:hypothetical protein [Pelodictyon luteolum]|uniref:Uncharacterized protein n=1 Tax=Chlorobium luteolum (strain DSM 273 / BCRC 81028 / 2530) TaxID=319225 RepID=Q3B1V0_CHLL3|nr:hypothetical protein [Pelodictyon luteolum]ABB24681.1 conserved hypothetical protein [Pelodictyon luteolum DSM 273]